MAKEKKSVHRVQMTEGKRNIIYFYFGEIFCDGTNPVEKFFIAFPVVGDGKWFV